MMWLLVFVGSMASAGTLVSADCQVEVSPESVVVGYGQSFSVNCSSPFNQTAGMGWESPQNGISFTPMVTFLILEIQSVRLWKLSPQCYVTLNDNTQCPRRLPVTVYKMPESVSMPQLSQPSSMVEGEKRLVKCDVTNVAPARNLSVLFHKGNKIVSTYTFNDSSLEPVNVSSVYDLIAQRDDNGARIWCEAKLNFLTAGLQVTSMLSDSQEVIVLYPPTFDKPENETLDVPADGKIILNCNATGNPAPVYSWHSPSPVEQSDMDRNNNQLILNRPLQYPGTYSCTASNLQGTTTKYFNLVEAPSSRAGTTAGILIAVFLVLIFILGCVVYQKQRKSAGNRSTFAAIAGGFLFLGAVIFFAGLYLVKSDGTCSLNKGSYRPTPSGPV